MIIYTDSRILIPEPHRGYTRLFVAFILRDERDNVGLIAHERAHVRFFLRAPMEAIKGWWAWRKGMSVSWKLRYEVDGYAHQCLEPGTSMTIQCAASLLADDRYNLGISHGHAYNLLTGRIAELERERKGER